MKKFFLLSFFLLFLPSGAQNTITVEYVLQLKDSYLVEEIQRSQGKKDFYLLNGWDGWAAYYAGREDLARELRADLWDSFGLPVPPDHPQKPGDK